MRVLITGGGGFLGGAIVDACLNRGYEVKVVGRNAYPWLTDKGVECIARDLSKDNAVDAFENVDAVFHVAAKPGLWGSFKSFYDANVKATENVIRFCKEKSINKLVHTSSPSVVFNGKDLENVNEDQVIPTHFHAHYPQTKAMAEKLVLAQNPKDLMTVALRPHLIWGPGDNHLIPRILSRASRGQLRIVGKGNKLVDTVFVDDAANAHLLALDKLEPNSPVVGKAYFISQDEPVSIFDWINVFVKAAGLPEVRRKVPLALARVAGLVLEWRHKIFRLDGEPRMTRFLAGELGTAHFFDISRAKSELGYQPSLSMEEAYDRTIKSEYFQNILADLKTSKL